MKISQLDHVAIVSADSKVSREWYQKVFGMEWVFQGRWENNPYFLQKGQSFIAIFQKGLKGSKSNKEGVRIDHFAFRAEKMTDYEEVKECLKRIGIPFEEQDHEISKSIYLKDPDEITVEVTTYDL